jgi:hypothetical protein
MYPFSPFRYSTSTITRHRQDFELAIKCLLPNLFGVFFPHTLDERLATSQTHQLLIFEKDYAQLFD